eukprot:jgi/Chrzof1/12892/Cz07g11090.t1
MHSAAESSAPTATAAAAAVRSAVDAAIETLTTKPGPMGPAGASSWSDPRSSQSMRSPPEWVEDPGSDVDEEVAAKHLVMQLLTHPQEAEAQLLREAEIEPGMNVSTAYIDAMVEAATDPGIGMTRDCHAASACEEIPWEIATAHHQQDHPSSAQFGSNTRPDDPLLQPGNPPSHEHDESRDHSDQPHPAASRD